MASNKATDAPMTNPKKTKASSDTSSRKKGKVAPREESLSTLQKLLHQKDIWMVDILPFVGIGQHAFVAGVDRRFRGYYKDFAEAIDDPPSVFVDTTNPWFSWEPQRPANGLDTFVSVAFSNLACTEFWDSDTNGDEERYTNVCYAAAKIGSIPVLKWAFDKGFSGGVRICAISAENGHLEVLKWARENGCSWDGQTCAWAAGGGHLDVLKWAHENGCLWDWRTCAWAAGNGHFEVLKWARENGCPWSKETCSGAAENGHLEVLKWAHQHGCPWDARTCSGAAENGHLDVLKYAHKNGCPWNKYTCSEAARYGHTEILKYARDNGCPGAVYYFEDDDASE